jgi:hypothetical protein
MPSASDVDLRDNGRPRGETFIAWHTGSRVTNKIIVESSGAFYNERIEAASAEPPRRQ